MEWAPAVVNSLGVELMRPETDHCPDENSMEGIERNEVSDAESERENYDADVISDEWWK